MKFVTAGIAAILTLAVVNEAWKWLTTRQAPIPVEVVVFAATFFVAWVGYSAFFEQKGGSSADARRR